MFEVAELGRKVSRQEFDEAVPALRAALLEAQFALKSRNIPVVVIVSGADCAGKGEFVHRLNEWLDPRGVDTHAFAQGSDEERARPRFWRFWRALPARGRIGIFFGSWYSEPMVQRVYREINGSQLDGELDRIAFFEKMLADDGALIVKFWFHLSRKEQAGRLKQLLRDPHTRHRVLPVDRKNFKLYERFIKTSERVIRRTDSAPCPWHLIEATDRRYRELAAGRILLESLQTRLKAGGAARPRTVAAAGPAPRTRPKRGDTILDHVDLSQKLTGRRYGAELEKYQGRLTRLTWEANVKHISTVAVLEGWDAAGKGSAIRRVTEAVDPRLYRIIPIAAPTDEERAHHYLWRFWRHLPPAGMVAIFDRSWYGRVLVERVEKFAAEEEWKRAYLEINDFEEQLADRDIALAKFWIHISKAEQLRRFQQRQVIEFKRYKITEEDWRNRKKWGAYQQAINDMVAHTSTEFAPWTVVAGNDKHFARVQILKTLCEALEKLL
ncbi:MAG TPA: polyphosphate:AMP phosphotransferase [Candidatus Acidoferrum sp.]|nr:polyphosphate:AMP phosphotransferase [Candidatus Acidoferrum sp.]